MAEVMAQMLAETGSASSAHRFGRRQSAAVDEAREHVAALVGGRACGPGGVGALVGTGRSLARL